MQHLTKLLAVGAMAMPAVAYAASTSGSASATVMTPLTIQADVPLSFGTFSPSDEAGTITSGGTTTGGVTKIAGGDAGTFLVSGASGNSYNLSGSASSVTLNRSGGGGSMNASLDYSTSGMLDGSGNGEITVTGTLSVAANQAAGNYSGLYNVTVNY